METRFTEIRKILRGRWKPDWPKDDDFGRLEAVLHGALNAVAKLEQGRAEIGAAGRLSEKGLTEEARKLALGQTVPALHRAAKTVEGVRSDLAQRRTQLATPKSDPGDHAGAAFRAEMRAWLRTLSPGTLMATLMDEKADGRLVLAALEAPPGMAGLSPQMQDQIRELNTARTHGPELDRLEQLDEAATVVEAALETSLYQLRRETDFSENNMIEFDKWMEGATAELEYVPPPPPIAANQPSAAPGENFNVQEVFDRIWAEHLPHLYPDHPVNIAKRSG